ncbi:hypothetical protein A176_002024 [Myxococcus hansupus]|uniref:Uncharacterized protein n=1 Tax=Pseudomyxococcus hansupus TaxID=1297742 RepID=A0A0H4XB57_9BACT|nr:hypothetical protein A176_002024 [Myxococcus hansupus]
MERRPGGLRPQATGPDIHASKRGLVPPVRTCQRVSTTPGRLPGREIHPLHKHTAGAERIATCMSRCALITPRSFRR